MHKMYYIFYDIKNIIIWFSFYYLYNKFSFIQKGVKNAKWKHILVRLYKKSDTEILPGRI